MRLLLDFLNKEISGIMPEALPFAVASALKKRYSDLPDDYSFVAFGRTLGLNYYSENSKYETIPLDQKMKELVNEIVLSASGDNYTLLINDHERYWSVVTKNVEIGRILRKLPMSITMSFDTVECVKIFK